MVRIIDSYQNPSRVASMLNIPAPPKSIQVIERESGRISDVIVTCAIKINPNEFPLLLAGNEYSENPYFGTSYSLKVPKLGPEFPVAKQYISYPPELQRGGRVRVFTNREKSSAIVDLYIE